MKVWITSDLHLNYTENRAFFFNLSSIDYKEDILIIAGDVSHLLTEIIALFQNLVPKFKKIMFVPGNHDVWITKKEIELKSLEKFNRILKVATEEGVQTTTLEIAGLAIVPLFSWYDFSFGIPTKIIKRAWQDFKKCHWHLPLNELTAHFLDLNQKALITNKKQIISFSHFLPHQELIPSQVPPIVKSLLPVFGAKGLGLQVKKLQPQMHIYGHSHLNRKVGIGNTVYINNAFGYPQEKHICRKRLLCIYADSQFIY